MRAPDPLSGHDRNGTVTRAAPKLISVVIPARNARATLDEQLKALAGQVYAGAWEVVVADNGSTDGTLAVARRFAEHLPALRLVDAPDRACAAHARNRGAASAVGDFLAFCDADDVVGPLWLAAMADCAHQFDIVGGAIHPYPPGSSSAEGAPAGSGGLPAVGGFLPMAFSGNFGIWAAVFTELGGWDEEYRIGEDIELSWRAQRNGYRLGFAADAVLWRRDPPGLRPLARRSFNYGLAGAHLYRSFRHLGARRNGMEAVRACGWIVTRAPAAAVSRTKRRRWVNVLARRTGRLAGSVRYRVFYP